MLKEKVYLRIYQSINPQFTHHDLYMAGILSSMVGHGKNHYELKQNQPVLIIAKSAISEEQPIDVGLFKIQSKASYNPWKSYGDFVTYNADVIASMQFESDSEHKTRLGSAYDVARTIGTGHQNSEKTRELALYLLLNTL